MITSRTSFTFSPVFKADYCGADPKLTGATITIEGITEEQVEYLRERMTRIYPDVVNYRQGPKPDEGV